MISVSVFVSFCLCQSLLEISLLPSLPINHTHTHTHAHAHAHACISVSMIGNSEDRRAVGDHPPSGYKSTAQCSSPSFSRTQKASTVCVAYLPWLGCLFQEGVVRWRCLLAADTCFVLQVGSRCPLPGLPGFCFQGSRYRSLG